MQQLISVASAVLDSLPPADARTLTAAIQQAQTRRTDGAARLDCAIATASEALSLFPDGRRIIEQLQRARSSLFE